jgi:putative endopeptidase
MKNIEISIIFIKKSIPEKIFTILTRCFFHQPSKIKGCNLSDQKSIFQLNMKLAVLPGDDFYNYVNSDWISSHPIPPDKSAADVFSELNDITEEHLRSLIEDAAQDSDAKRGSLTQKIGDLYRSGMDTGSIDRQELAPIRAELDRIDALQRISDVQVLMAHLVSYGIAPCFELFAEIDPKNSTMMIAALSQGGLGLPNKEYYLKKDLVSDQIRTRYQTHIVNMFQLLGTPVGSAGYASGIIFGLETRLARASYSPEENRDPDAVYHPVNLDGLGQIAPGIDWHNFFLAVDYPGVQKVNVHQPRFFSELSVMLSTIGIDTWKLFLRWKVISVLAPFLPSGFEQENFDFYGKILNGQPQMKPRWKRVLAALNYSLGDAIGRMYVERYFPPEAKNRMLTLVGNLRDTFRSRIENLSWMGPDTKKAALQKLSHMQIKIGYPDKWQDYHDLEVDTDSYVMNVIRAMKYDFSDGPLGLSRAGKPVDKTTWFMHPQIINAYYDPGMNEIVFPAAILQPPFFDMNASDATNYGAIGAIIGHEMTHGFDDTGRKYDRDGNLHDWWTEDDEKKFIRQTRILVDQYSAQEVLPGLFAKGALTLGENIADLGGLTIAFHAYTKLQKEQNDPRTTNGFSEFQHFFISYATIWRENIRPESLRNQVLSDVHSPNHMRVNCVVFNMPEFYAAFPDISQKNGLYRPPEKRPAIW